MMNSDDFHNCWPCSSGHSPGKGPTPCQVRSPAGHTQQQKEPGNNQHHHRQVGKLPRQPCLSHQLWCLQVLSCAARRMHLYWYCDSVGRITAQLSCYKPTICWYHSTVISCIISAASPPARSTSSCLRQGQ
jgi:hypothetical protein